MGKQRNEQETYSRNVGFKYRAAYTAGNLVEYEGWAYPTALTSDAKWSICKHTYDGNNNLTQTDWAGGNDEFNKIWDNRASLSYS